MIPALRQFFHPRYAPVYIPTLLSLAGTLFMIGGSYEAKVWLLTDRWSLPYFLIAPFLHAGGFHFMLNVMALHFIGGMMLLPLLRARRFVLLFVLAVVAGNLANNVFTDVPAIGISAGIMGLLSCALYPFGRAPMKFLLIHDLFRLPPFPLRYVAVGIVLLDIAGILFGWRFFSHWGHLGGFVTGLVFGYFVFRSSVTSKGKL